MSECREWRGARTGRGYGTTRRDGQVVYVHRLVMAMVHGWDALDGKVVMHVCDNPPCFRFDHLRIGTTADNAADMSTKRRGMNQHRAQVAAGTVSAIFEMRNAGAGQQAIADCLGLSQATVSNYLTGVRK